MNPCSPNLLAEHLSARLVHAAGIMVKAKYLPNGAVVAIKLLERGSYFDAAVSLLGPRPPTLGASAASNGRGWGRGGGGVTCHTVATLVGWVEPTRRWRVTRRLPHPPWLAACQLLSQDKPHMLYVSREILHQASLLHPFIAQVRAGRQCGGQALVRLPPVATTTASRRKFPYLLPPSPCCWCTGLRSAPPPAAPGHSNGVCRRRQPAAPPAAAAAGAAGGARCPLAHPAAHHRAGLHPQPGGWAGGWAWGVGGVGGRVGGWAWGVGGVGGRVRTLCGAVAPGVPCREHHRQAGRRAASFWLAGWQAAVASCPSLAKPPAPPSASPAARCRVWPAVT